MIYLVFGNQSPMVKKRINKIAKESIGDNFDDMNFVKYDSTTNNIFEIIDEANSIPLGYDRKAIVLDNCLFLSTDKKNKLDDESTKILIDYLEDPNDSTDLFFACYSGLDSSSNIVKKIKEVGKIVEILDPNQNEWREYVSKYCKESLKIDIKNDAIQELANRTQGDAASLINNANKLSLYSNVITYEDVCLLVTRPFEDNIFQIFNLLINKKINNALSLYRDLVTNNVKVNDIIAILGNQFRLLNEVLYLSSLKKNNKEIADELKIKEIRVEIMRKQLPYLSSSTINKTLDDLYNLDWQIKSGQIDYDNRYFAFELFLLNFKVK